MKKEPLVSVVIPVYNAERFLEETIQSVLEQTYPAVECIAVNDGSTDASDMIAQSFGSKIRYFSKSNSGVSATRNFGIRQSNGEFVAFLDADDVWLKENISEQMKLFSRDDRIGIVYSGIGFLDETSRVLGNAWEASAEDLIENILLLKSGTGYFSSTGIVRRQHLEIVGSFDERLSTSADADLVLRFALMKFKILPVEKPLAYYRIHGNQMHHNLNALEHDMGIVLDKFFAAKEVPYELKGLRNKAWSSLDSTLAVGYLRNRQLGKSLKHLSKAIWRRPDVPYKKIKTILDSKI